MALIATASSVFDVDQGGTGTSTQFTEGSVIFSEANGIYSQDNANLFWDNTNKYLGINTNDPDVALEVQGEVRIRGGSTTVPSIKFGNAAYPNEIGWGSDGENEIWMYVNNFRRWTIRKDHFGSTDSNGPHIHRVQENNTVYSFRASQTTGIGFSSPDKLKLTTDGTIAVLIDGSQQVGIGTITPNSDLDVDGSISLSITSVATTTMLDATHYTVLVDTSASPITINLPAVSGITGRVYHIKKTDNSANSVIINANGAEEIDDSTTATLTNQFESISIQSDENSWWIF